MKTITSILSEYNKESFRIQNKCILLVNVREKLSQLVSRRIKELGIRNIDVANKTGLSRSYIGNMANGTAPTPTGEYNPSNEVVAKLAKALEVSETEILSAMNYLPQNNGTSEVDKIAARLAEGVLASGLGDLEDEDLKEAFFEDMQSIAESMLKRRIKEQEKRKSEKAN